MQVWQTILANYEYIFVFYLYLAKRAIWQSSTNYIVIMLNCLSPVFSLRSTHRILTWCICWWYLLSWFWCMCVRVIMMIMYTFLSRHVVVTSEVAVVCRHSLIVLYVWEINLKWCILNYWPQWCVIRVYAVVQACSVITARHGSSRTEAEGQYLLCLASPTLISILYLNKFVQKKKN